jgi:hypothetical protein
MGVPEHLIVLIKSLYMRQEAAVKTEYGNTQWFEVSKGVRQGCILSPYVFNLYSEYILRRVGFEEDEGIKVGGRTINSLTLCRSYLNPYCLGRKTAFFSVGI